MLSILLLVGYESYGQVNTSSPYSRFGLGEIESFSLGRASSMGGISIGLSLPFEINIMNPASYSSVPAQAFLFQAGIRSRQTSFTSDNGSSQAYDNGLTSLNLAFRVTKFWGMSFGVNPVSSIGYEIYSEDSVTVGDNSSKVSMNYVGEGGLTQLYLGNAFSYKGLSIGVNAAYIFGPMTQRIESLYDGESYSSFLLDMKYTNVSDFNFKYGIQYSDSLLGKYKYTVGAVYENKTNLKTQVTRYTQSSLVNEQTTIHDTLFNDTITSGTVGMPQSYGVGFSVITKKLIFGVDYKLYNWENVEFLGETKEYITNSDFLAGGIEFTPNYLSKKFFNRMSYRVGGHISNTYVKLNDTQIVDKSVSFGIGIPTKSGSKFNIGFEMGQKGTTDNGLIQENYYIINLNVSLIDRWFIKRKFE